MQKKSRFPIFFLIGTLSLFSLSTVAYGAKSTISHRNVSSNKNTSIRNTSIRNTSIRNTSKETTGKLHHLNTDSCYFLYSPLERSPLTSISSSPSNVRVTHGTAIGQNPGLAHITYLKEDAIQTKAFCVPGLLPGNSLIKAGAKRAITPFGIKENQIMHWGSSNPAVASVNSKGVVLGKCPGTAVITCQTKSKKIYTTTVDVMTSGQYEQVLAQREKQAHNASNSSDSAKKEPFYAFVLSCEESTLFMQPGESYIPKVTVRRLSARSAFPDLVWESADRSVASVDKNGCIHAESDGMTIISCQAEDQKISFSLNVVSDGKSGKSCTFTMLTGNTGQKRTYTLFKQNAHNYDGYNRYLAWHGCAHCSFATVLGAYNTNYAGVKPDEIIRGVEKKLADPADWSKQHEERSLPHQMPFSLYGISSLLRSCKVANDYIPSFNYKEAKFDILTHLKNGNPVIFEVRQKNHYTKKSSKRWTNSYHTMVFLGAFTDNRVLVCDSVDRSWYDGGQRYKIVSIDDVMAYMFSSTKSTTKMYFNGAASDGGYIKVN